MQPFDLHLRTRLVFGAGTLSRLGELAGGLGARRVLLVTDPHLVAAGHAPRAVRSLEEAGLEVRRYEDVHENPTSADVERCVAFAREGEPELLVAVGGGSSIDTAKGANFLYTNGGAMEDYRGMGKAHTPLLPMIAVPTTAGTGSEVQSFALVERPGDHQKMACGDPSAAPAVALLDPELTATMPRRVAACTGLDALTHALETAVTTKRNPASSLFSTEAFRLANEALPRVLRSASNEGVESGEARGAMLLAAAWAGLAIECSMLGAAHSLANPLTARFPLQHGQAVGTMLPHVIRFNAAEPTAAAEYHRLALLAGLCAADETPEDAALALAARVEELLALAGLPAGLGAHGVDDAAVDGLAAMAAEQWTARFNPRAVGASELAGLYRAALRA